MKRQTIIMQTTTNGDNRQPTSFANLAGLIEDEQRRQARSVHTSFLDIASTRDAAPAPDDQASRAAVEALARQPSATRLHGQSSNPAPTIPPKGERTIQGPPPTDWSLKSFLRILSDDAEVVQTELWNVATRAVVMSEDPMDDVHGDDDGNANVQSIPNATEYAAGIHWWQHPVERWDGAATKALVQAGHAAMMQRRRNTHRESFRSLYYAVRQGTCPCAYWLPPVGARKPMCVMFRAAGQAGCGKVLALVSHSSRGLRNMLRSDTVGVEFTMPWAPHVTAETDQEEGPPTAKAPPNSDLDIDNTQRSLLLVQGPHAVHALFDFLYNNALGRLYNELDVPLILAPMPFEGGTLTSPTIKVTGCVESAGGRVRAEVHPPPHGALPPWSIQQLWAEVESWMRMVNLIKTGTDTPPPMVRVSQEPHPLTIGFNIPLVDTTTINKTTTTQQKRKHTTRSARDDGVGWVEGAWGDGWGGVEGGVVRALLMEGVQVTTVVVGTV